MSRIQHVTHQALLLPFLWLFTAAQIAVANDQPAEFNEIIATPALLEQVQQGGFVLYVRHGNTDNSRPDRAPSVDLKDCTTQRVLSEKGIQATQKLGENMRAAQIPVGEVLASPMCRAKNSAKHAFGDYTIDNKLMYTGNLTSKQKLPIIANTRKLLSTPVSPEHSNRVLVAHAPNLMDLLGYFPVETTVVIFHPQGNNQFKYLGSIRPQDWKKLLSN